MLKFLKSKYRKNKLAKLQKEEEKWKKEYYSFLDSPLSFSLTDESIEKENYLSNHYEWAIQNRRDYELKVMLKPIKKHKKGKEKNYGKKI